MSEIGYVNMRSSSLLTCLMESNPATLASAATHRVDGFGPLKADFSRPLDIVMLHLWSGRPKREVCLAGKREKSVKWVNNYFRWYKCHGFQKLMLLKARQLLIRQQTMLTNAIRAHLAEFSIVSGVGPTDVEKLPTRSQWYGPRHLRSAIL
jgi:hypothetical protein